MIGIAGINSTENFIEVRSNEFVAIAADTAQRVHVRYVHPAATRHDDLFGPEPSHHSADITTADAEQARELFLGQTQLMIPGTVDRGQQPFRGSLFNRMGGVASRGLKYLCEQAIRVSRE